MPQQDDKERRDPFADLDSGEPVVDLGMTATPSVLARPPKGERKTPIRPAEKRRKRRMLTATFSSADIPDRIRALAEKWGMETAAGNPNTSAVVEYLLLPQLERAEAGAIPPPAGE